MAEASPKEINHDAISRAFGTPKPTLANSYEPELLNLRTFPTLMGFSRGPSIGGVGAAILVAKRSAGAN